MGLTRLTLGAAMFGALLGPWATNAERARRPELDRRSLDSLSSSAWLALLPDGEEKRRFILDCTGCHQFDGRVARANGPRARTEAEWAEAVQRMLRYAGATTGFPVIAGDRDPKATAAWLARHLAREPSAPKAHAATVVRDAVVEFTLPEPRDLPHDVAVDRDGRVITTGMMTHQMYVFEPAGGRFSPVAIPVPRANPRAVEIDSAGNWWVVLGGPNMLARYTPATKQWATYAVGMYPHSLALGRAGQVWFNGHFTREPELIGRVDATGTVRTHAVPAHPVLAARPGGPIPYEIRAGPDGRVWGSELLGNRLFAFTPGTGEFTVHDMPAPHSGPRRFDIDSTGVLWVPAYATNELVRFDPRTKSFTPFPLPVPDAVPYVVRIDHALGRVWIGTSAADVVLAFDPRTRRFTVYPLPSRGALVRHLAIDPRTHDLWVAYGASPGIPARLARVTAR